MLRLRKESATLRLKVMPTTQMPDHLTKISYILPKDQKEKVAEAAKKAGVSMSVLISRALQAKGILPKRAA